MSKSIEEQVEDLVAAVYNHPEIEEETGTEEQAIKNILTQALQERDRIAREEERKNRIALVQEFNGDLYVYPEKDFGSYYLSLNGEIHNLALTNTTK